MQGSTQLWEMLPADVMDSAMREHHRIMRHALVMHDGYESATEGDSFIMAFRWAMGEAVERCMLNRLVGFIRICYRSL